MGLIPVRLKPTGVLFIYTVLRLSKMEGNSVHKDISKCLIFSMQQMCWELIRKKKPIKTFSPLSYKSLH